MITFGIIGTAGRGSDFEKLNRESYKTMILLARKIIKLSQARYNEAEFALVSGGAAWADSVAVSLFTLGFCNDLTLHLPCKFDTSSFTYELNDTGRTATYYHERFSTKIGVNKNKSILSIGKALKSGAKYTESKGFFIRNSLVAEQSDILIAFTFGSGAKLKGGGTADTMAKFLKLKPADCSFHVDLHTMKAYNPARV